MNFNEFLDELLEVIKIKVGEEVSVNLNKVIKNNDIHLNGLCFKKEGVNAAPTIYVDNYYGEYQKGRIIDDIANDVISVFEENQLDSSFEVDFFKNFDHVKGHLFAKVINYGMNQELLEMTPHRKYLDLAIVVYCRVNNIRFGNASILIRNNHLDMWGIEEEKLIDSALENTREKMRCNISRIGDVLMQMDGSLEISKEESSEVDMYVATNEERLYGAIFMVYPDVLREFYEISGGEYIILPSSIHEVLVLPGNHDDNMPEINKMIQDINTFSVSREEVLSDHAYKYSDDAQVLIF